MRSLPSAVIKTTSITLPPLTSLTSTLNALKNDGQKCDRERGRKCVEGPAGRPSGRGPPRIGFYRSQIVKYMWRRRDKGAPLEDAKKAQFYLDQLIQKLS